MSLSHQCFVLKKKITPTSYVEVNVWGSYYLYKHLTSIKKRQEENCSHTHAHRTEHLREMTRRGQHSTPKWTVERTGEEKNNGRGKETLQCVGWRSGHGACRGHAGPSSTTDISAGPSTARPGKSRTRLRCAALDIFCVRWSWDCFSVLCCAGLDWDTRVVLLCWPWRASVVLDVAAAGLRWIWGGLFSGRRELSTFPLPSGATPRPWRCRCPWGVLISSASTGALYAGFFRSEHMEIREHSATNTHFNPSYCHFTLQWLVCKGEQKSLDNHI